MEGKSKILPGLKDQLEQAHVKRRKLADAEAALRQKDIAVQEAQKQVSYLESERVRLDKEIGETGEKLDLIASHVAAHTEARCPLCDQELTREALALIQSKYAQEKKEKTDAVIVNGENLSHKRAEFEALSREKVEMESGLNQEKTRLQSQEDLLKSKIKEIEENNLKIAELRGALNDIEQRLARREFAAAEQQALGAIENELTALGYNEAEREAAQKKFKELQNYEREKQPRRSFKVHWPGKRGGGQSAAGGAIEARRPGARQPQKTVAIRRACQPSHSAAGTGRGGSRS